MSSSASAPENGACGDEVAAYVLGALEGGEIAAFQAHLQRCTICRDELSGFQDAADLLATSAPPYPAPSGLRRRVLAAVARDPNGAVRPTRPRRRPLRPRRVRLVRHRRPFAWGAAVAAIAVAAGVLDLRAANRSGPRTYAAQVTGAGSAAVTVTGGRAELIVHHFPAPPTGQVYQVWLRRPGRPPIPTSALFSVTTGGDGDVDVPGNLRGVDEMMVTAEPAGGSRVPTHAAVIYAQLG